MKKELTALCIALAALNGCASDETRQSGDADDFSSTGSALLGESGGLPWGSEAASQIISAAPAADMTFGKSLGVGTINENAGVDIVTAEGGLYGHGKVSIKYDNSAALGVFEYSDGKNDGFGTALAVGKFCPESTTYNPAYDMVIASAPTANGYTGGFGIIHKRKTNKTVAVMRRMNVTSNVMEMAGTQLAVGDVNGDGKNDLIYQSTPVDPETYDWLPTRVNVVLDICSKGTTLKPDAVVSAAEDYQLFGSAVYVVDLDNSGTSEIVVVDRNYFAADNKDLSANGAIFFYTYKDGALVESRKPIIGDMNEVSGASISSVAFSDIDGDGDLDLIVGEPMYNSGFKREGRVRTYTNNGAAGFDAADMKWSASAGHSYASFGASVTIADVNFDGVDDLIVGAPGRSFNDQDKDMAQGRVYVYMGTKDGSVFSKEPFWTITSDVSTAANDAFGRNVVAANIDKVAGSWLDLVVTAPTFSTGNNNKQGRIDVFHESSNFCYTASRCLIDGVCYEAGATSDDSRCAVCEPTKDNFGFSELVCDGFEDACHEAAVCEPAVGCVIQDKADGTVCAENACIDNALVVSTCQAGACKAESVSCGDYVCDAGLNACPAACTTDSDCMDGLVCISGACAIPVNEPPVIALEPAFSGMVGSAVVMTATVTDPENDELTYLWDCASSSGKSFSMSGTSTTEASLNIPPSESDTTTYACSLTVTDSAGNVSVANTTVSVTGVSVSITSPENGFETENTSITFSGKSDGKGSVNVVSNGQTVCTSKITAKGVWSCTAELAVGSYTVEAVWASNTSYKSDPASFTINEVFVNQPPVIVVDSEYEVELGSSVTLNASASYDPDGDAIEFLWTGEDTALLSSVTSASPTLVLPSPVAIGTIYSFTLVVTDSNGGSSTQAVTVTVTSPDILIDIVAPKDGEVVVGPEVTVSGTSSISGSIQVRNDEAGLCSTVINDDGTWSCSYSTAAGKQSVHAIWTDGINAVETSSVEFEVVDPVIPNQPPVAILQNLYTVLLGDSVVLDGSASYDPDEGDTLTYTWTGDALNALSATDVAAPTFTALDSMIAGQAYHYTLTVTDSHGASASVNTDVLVVSTGENPVIEIITPAEGALVNNPILVSGTTAAKSPVLVFDYNGSDTPICDTISDDKGAWNCSVVMNSGVQLIRAEVLDADKKETYDADFRTFVVSGDEAPVPVITTPVTGDTVSIRPTVAGTVDATSGKVSVWTVDGSVSTLLCTADVQKSDKSGVWSCTAGYDLARSTKYDIQAYWKDGDNTSAMSEKVTVVTQDAEISDIIVLSPANGSELPMNYPIIIAGSADAGTIVDVYISDSTGNEVKACSAMANSDGYWACSEVALTPDHFTLYADDASDSKIVKSNVVEFDVIFDPNAYPSTDSKDDVRGGSCSIQTTPASNFGWMFLIAGFAGFGLLRRRRS